MDPHPTPDPIRLELVQFRPRKRDVEGNLRRIADRIAAAAGTTDVLVFPEAALSGYFVEGGVSEVARSVGEVADALGVPPEHAPDVVVGFYEAGNGAIYNAAAWFAPGGGRYRPVHCHRKLFLPTYGVFDEARFVSPGQRLEAFDSRFGRVGLLVCEEMFHALPPTILALDGAQLLVALAASPGRDLGPGVGIPGNMSMWDVAGRAITQEHGVYLAVAHLVGSEGGKLFPGGSALYGPGGTLESRGPVFEEGSVPGAIDLERVRRTQVRFPLLSDLRTMLPHLLPALSEAGKGESEAGKGNGEPAASERPAGTEAPSGSSRSATPRSVLPDPHDQTMLEIDPALVEKALLFFLRDEVERQRGFRNVVVGVSGGVDSAVTLALAVRAFGAERVHPFLLPYATSSPESLEHGMQVLRSLGVEGRTIPITHALDGYISDEEPGISDLRRGNAAARFRTLVLWDQAARLGGLVLGTGNKSERLLGYFTWHADDSPPINPLGDLYKSQVLTLARHLGLPAVVIDKAPSADLVEGVTDEDEIGVSYAVADRILFWILEGYGVEELARAGFNRSEVETVSRRLEGTHWKRRPPSTAVVSSTAIGEFYLRPLDF